MGNDTNGCNESEYYCIEMMIIPDLQRSVRSDPLSVRKRKIRHSNYGERSFAEYVVALEPCGIIYNTDALVVGNGLAPLASRLIVDFRRIRLFNHFTLKQITIIVN